MGLAQNCMVDRGPPGVFFILIKAGATFQVAWEIPWTEESEGLQSVGLPKSRT